MDKTTKMLQVRELAQLSFRAGQMDTIDIPRGYSIARLRFRLTGTLSRAAGASAGAGKDLTGAQLVKRLELRKNGREVVKALDFESLMRFNQMRRGTLPEWALSAVWTGYAVKSATTFALSASLDNEMWDSIQPMDTLFDSSSRNNIVTLQLAIYWGALSDLMTAAYNPSSGGVTADVTPTLAISVEEYVDPDALPGEYAENREYSIRQVISATNPKQQIPINIGNWFRQFTVKAYADDVQRNDIVNNIIIRSGSQVFINRAAEALRQENKMTAGLETAIDGYYLVDFCKDGHLTRALPTAPLSELIVELDVTKQGTVCVVEIFPTEIVRQLVSAG